MLDYRLGNKNAMLALDIVCVLELVTYVTYLRPSSVGGFSDSLPRHARVVRCADGLADCPYVLYGNLGEPIRESRWGKQVSGFSGLRKRWVFKVGV